MKLQDQVITFLQSKRIKELGVNQNSLFSWFGDEEFRLRDNGASVEYSQWLWLSGTEPYNNQEADWRANASCTKPLAAAFTVAELGLMIGKGTNAAALLYDAVQDQMNRSYSFTICYSPQFLANCIKEVGYDCFAGIVIEKGDDTWPSGMFSDTWTLSAFTKVKGTKGQKEMEAIFKKAAKWDALDDKIGGFYVDEKGDELEEEEGGDLADIGEAAAIAFGYL